jgi:hypothetical protein
MPTSRKSSTKSTSAAPRSADARKRATQPAATGANRGSPVASVMKQFQKTTKESTGRS